MIAAPFLLLFPKEFPHTLTARIPNSEYPIVIWEKFTDKLAKFCKGYASEFPQGNFVQRYSVFTTKANLMRETFRETDFGAPNERFLPLVAGQQLNISKDVQDQLAFLLPLFVWQYNVFRRSLILSRNTADGTNEGDPVEPAIHSIIERNRLLSQAFATGTSVAARTTDKWQSEQVRLENTISAKRKSGDGLPEGQHVSPKRRQLLNRQKRGSQLDETGTPFYMTRSRVRVRSDGSRRPPQTDDPSGEKNLVAPKEDPETDAAKCYDTLRQFLSTFLDRKLLHVAVSGAAVSKDQRESDETLQEEIHARLDKITHHVDGQTITGDGALEKMLDEYVLGRFDSEKEIGDYAILLSCLDMFFPVL